MGREHVVVRTQRGRDADGDGLLADGGMQESRNAAALKQLAGALLEQPDAEHRRVHLHHELRAGRAHRAAIIAPGTR